MAVALGAAFGTGALVWLQRESAYRLSLVEPHDPETQARARLYGVAPVKDMERRGWIDYRRTYPGRIDPGAVGPAFLAIQGLLQPDRKPAYAMKTAVRTEQDDQAAPPDPEHPSEL